MTASSMGQFNSPSAIAIDSSGNIFVSDGNAGVPGSYFRIQKFYKDPILVGIDMVKANPGNYQLFTQAQIDAAKQAAIQSCKDNPASCGLFGQTQIDAAKQEGINLVKANPDDYQLFTQAQLDTAVSSATAQTPPNKSELIWSQTIRAITAYLIRRS
jgi:hypothetical protein